MAKQKKKDIELTFIKMTIKDLKILNNLLARTESLPDILHLRAAEIGFTLTKEDKSLLLKTYTDLDDILKEVAAFINIKFPGCERHVRAWNEIDFDTKIGQFKIITTDREHIKREWRKGIFDLKSLIKILKNEVVLLIDDLDEHHDTTDLGEISSSHNIEYYTDKQIIPNQNLVTDTIDYFKSGPGSKLFNPIDFLNLLDKQYQFLKFNFNKGELVIQHLKDLPLTNRKKHSVLGFILKWFGGYPVNNLNEDFDRTLKMVQKEFLNFDGDTPEKEFCKADQAMRNKFEKYGIAFTTAINNNIDVNEILAAMEIEEPKEKAFLSFNELFMEAVNNKIVKSFINQKELLIAQSSYNYEFNVWLQTHRSWEYRNDEQYKKLLSIDIFTDFLAFKDSKKRNISRSEINVSTDERPLSASSNPTIRQIALICHYTNQTVTRKTAKKIVENYHHNSGDALFNHYTYYRSKSNRIGAEDSKKKNSNKIRLFESVLPHIHENEIAKNKLETDIQALKSSINAVLYTL